MTRSLRPSLTSSDKVKGYPRCRAPRQRDGLLVASLRSERQSSRCSCARRSCNSGKVVTRFSTAFPGLSKIAGASLKAQGPSESADNYDHRDDEYGSSRWSGEYQQFCDVAVQCLRDLSRLPYRPASQFGS